MSLTNFERWCIYTSGLSSPQNYIDWAWLYLVGACLQRRVWVGPEHQPIFANKYVIFVGEPGIGKGLPIREVSFFLKHWKKKDGIKIDPLTLSEANLKIQNIVEESDVEAAKKQLSAKAIVEPMLYPVAADATTYEALVKAVSESYSRCEYIDTDGKLKVHGHSSLCFCLQELASLMRKKTEDTINYMLGLYDCPMDYEYATKNSGTDRVRRGCLNMLAGTTPSFMQSTFDDRLADEGFNSRTFYIYAKNNRKNLFFITDMSTEQREHQFHLLEHIRKLSGLYGHAYVDKETMDYLQDWWHEQESNKEKMFHSPKLKPYRSRRNIHIMKIAMALHFSESLEMKISLATFKKAIEFLSNEEPNMHFAITIADTNPIAKCSRKVIDLLATGEKTYKELLIDTHYLIDKKGFEESLQFLSDTKQIVSRQDRNEDTEKIEILYKLKIKE